MKKTMWDLIRLLLPMNAEKRKAYGQATPYLGELELRHLKQLLKMDRTFPVAQNLKTTVTEDREWPLFKSHLKDDELQQFLATINTAIGQKVKHEVFIAFAPNALSRIAELLAPNIIGMTEVKRGVALTLFAKEPVHVLLLGDPGTGKTDLLRGLHQVAPISSYGLGSGSTAVGLAAMAKGNEIILGLLPLADGGIACIDELNLMKPRDMAALYNAMEKGFITYDKGSKHEQLPARVRLAAAGNPTGDTFIGKGVEALRKQVPFDDALLSRFHLLFMVRKPNDEEFRQIASAIVQNKHRLLSKEDAQFIKEYVGHALELDVQLDPHLEQEIMQFVKELKANERNYLVEIGPRTVVGLIRVAKAIARSNLSAQVDTDHLQLACTIMRSALTIRKPEKGKAA
jgi:replicative DNA helicase Mcm